MITKFPRTTDLGNFYPMAEIGSGFRDVPVRLLEYDGRMFGVRATVYMLDLGKIGVCLEFTDLSNVEPVLEFTFDKKYFGSRRKKSKKRPLEDRSAILPKRPLIVNFDLEAMQEAELSPITKDQFQLALRILAAVEDGEYLRLLDQMIAPSQ